MNTVRLKIADVSVPTITDDEVLIKVKASGLINGDILARKGVDPADLISVTKTFRLEEIQEAHRRLENKYSIGELGLVMDG